MKSTASKTVFLYILICLIWGSTWLAIKLGLESLTPLISSGLRFILASSIIFTIMRIRKYELNTDRSAIALYILMGLFTFALPFAFIYWGEQYVPSGLAAILFAVYPFCIALISYFMIPDEGIGFLKLAGMIISFSGIVVIFSDQFGGDINAYLLGMAAIVASAVMQAAMAVIIKKRGHHLHPMTMSFIPMIICGLLLTITGMVTEDISKLRFDSNAVLSVSYLALFGSVVTFTSYYWLLKHVNIVLLSLVAFITPVIALFLGWIINGEVLLAHQLTGSVMVCAGLLTANLSGILNKRTLIKQA